MEFFFFKQKTAYEIKECDWSSNVCSSDLCILVVPKSAREETGNASLPVLAGRPPGCFNIPASNSPFLLHPDRQLPQAVFGAHDSKATGKQGLHAQQYPRNTKRARFPIFKNAGRT